MVGIEFTVLAILNLILVGLVLALAVWIRKVVEINMAQLDSNLAQALKSTVQELTEGGLADFEPINPVQAAVAQWIASMATQNANTITASIVERAADGTFSSLADEAP